MEIVLTLDYSISLMILSIKKQTIYKNCIVYDLLTQTKGRQLMSPVPGFSKHGESADLTPLIDWNKFLFCQHDS
jgi:predicted aldo/keto reductase-like oxidoreductase